MALTHSDSLVRATARASFWTTYLGLPSIFDGLVAYYPSNSDQETYPSLGAAPNMREMTATKLRKSIPAQEYTIKNKKWEGTFVVDYSTRKFEKLGVVRDKAAELAEKARRHTDKLISQNFLLNAYAAAGGTCIDGQYFFDVDHADPGAEYTTSQLNYHTTNVTEDALTVAEFSTAAHIAFGRMLSYVDGVGDPFYVGPAPDFVCMVPGAYYGTAQQVSTSEVIAGNTNDLARTFRVVVNPYLSSASGSKQIFFFNASCPKKPFIVQIAEPPSLEDDIGLQNDFDTKDVAFSAFYYGNVGYGEWRTAYYFSAT